MEVEDDEADVRSLSKISSQEIRFRRTELREKSRMLHVIKSGNTVQVLEMITD